MNFRVKNAFLSSTMLSGLLTITPVHAGVFAGTNLQLENLGPNGDYPNTLVDFTVPVSGTIQFDWGPAWNRAAPIIVDVTDTGTNTAIVTLTETIPTAFNYAPSPNLALFSAITKTIPTFTNVTLDSSTTAAYYDPSRVLFTGTTFSYDFGGLTITNGGFVQLDITTASAVPLPGAIWLFGSALAGFIGFNRRKQCNT